MHTILRCQVYLIQDFNGITYYVGSGTKERAFKSQWEHASKGIATRVIFHTLPMARVDARSIERQLIKFYQLHGQCTWNKALPKDYLYDPGKNYEALPPDHPAMSTQSWLFKPSYQFRTLGKSE